MLNVKRHKGPRRTLKGRIDSFRKELPQRFERDERVVLEHIDLSSI